MACSKPVQSGLQRLIECSICLEVYQIPHKLPKNLQCGHTFCSECLRKLVEASQINCSKCRQKTLAPSDEVDKLATNFSVLDVLETSCEECRNQQWLTRCSHCEKNVCEACHSSHLKLGQADIQDRLDEAKERIQQIADTCNEDIYLMHLDDKAETAEEEVIEYWDGVASKVEDRKNQDLLKIRNNHKEACDVYIKWKENVHVSVAKAKSAVDKFSSRSRRKYLGPITSEEVEDITQQTEKLVTDLESDVNQNPAVTRYELDLTSTSLQSLLQHGVVKITCEESPTFQKITKQPIVRNPLPQYIQATHSLTYGQKGSGAGQFEGPWGVASCARTGNLVITDYSNHRIHILTSTFQPVSMSGSEGSGDGQYTNPWGVAVSHNTDQIYVVDQSNNRIQVLKGDGSHHSVLDYCGSGDDVLQIPRGIAIDRSGLLYVCDGHNNRIKFIHPDGRLITSFGTVGSGSGEFSSDPWFIAVSQDNKVVVSDIDGHLYIFTSKGQHIKTIHKKHPGSFDHARGVAIDQFGNIIVADKTGRVVVLREDGQVVCKIGSPGLLKLSMGVALTPEGDIVVADYGNHRILLFRVPKS